MLRQQYDRKRKKCAELAWPTQLAVHGPVSVSTCSLGTGMGENLQWWSILRIHTPHFLQWCVRLGFHASHFLHHLSPPLAQYIPSSLSLALHSFPPHHPFSGGIHSLGGLPAGVRI